jgi:hypothetical protein
MIVSTTDILVLRSVEVAHLYPQVVLPICHGFVRTPYTSIEDARLGIGLDKKTRSSITRSTRLVSDSAQLGSFVFCNELSQCFSSVR